VGLPKDAAIPTLTPETAARRAIVYVPNALDAKQEVEYVVFLHGHTEDSRIRPFAGWRAFKPPTPRAGPASEEALSATSRWTRSGGSSRTAG
jgi:hypothetical protein